MTHLKKTTPESMGIPSVSLYNFIKKLDQHNIPMHSLLVARKGNLVFESYYAPYTKDTLHRMFSVTKNLVSIAIGQLADSGHLKLDDPIIDYFPEYLPEGIHPYLSTMTIGHMLKMQTCYSATTYKDALDQDWLASFFTSLPSHRPGTVFNYDTSSSHTLCALVEKLTGKDLLTYLREVFLDAIGFSQEAYVLCDPFGHSMGGSGLMAKPMDLMLFAMTVLNDGVFNGTQLLSDTYLQDALKYHSHTLINGPVLEEGLGYGYQFWRIQHNGFACYGMGGQLAICLPDEELIVVTTGDTQGISGGNQHIYNSLYEEILPHLSDVPLTPIRPHQRALSDLQSQLCIAALKGMTSNTHAPSIHKKDFTLDPNPQGFSNMSIHINDQKKEGHLAFCLKTKNYTLPFKLGKMSYSMFPIYDQNCATSAIWLDATTLYIKSHIIDESLGSVHFHLTFSDKTLSVYMKKIVEHSFEAFSGYLEGSHH